MVQNIATFIQRKMDKAKQTEQRLWTPFIIRSHSGCTSGWKDFQRGLMAQDVGSSRSPGMPTHQACSIIHSLNTRAAVLWLENWIPSDGVQWVPVNGVDLIFIYVRYFRRFISQFYGEFYQSVPFTDGKWALLGWRIIPRWTTISPACTLLHRFQLSGCIFNGNPFLAAAANHPEKNAFR